MGEHVIIVKCNKCGKPQQTLVRTMTVTGKVKCVYCSKSINKKSSLVQFVR